MEVQADRTFQVAKKIDAVWELLRNPARVVMCIPGAQLTETLDDSHFRGKVSIKIGPVTAKFNGEAEFSKLNAESHELVLSGKGTDTGGKGNASMSMHLKLTAKDSDCTEVSSRMTMSINGKLAQFGARMIVAVNNKLFDQFIRDFTIMASGTDEESEAPIPDEPEPVKAVSLVGSVMMSSLKEKLEQKKGAQ